jgi:Tol biopolymer transport system component
MKRWLRYPGIAALAVAGPVAAYYALPLAVTIVSLGEICPYSPSGTSLCHRSAQTKPGLRPSPSPNPTLRASGKLAFAASVDKGDSADIFVINADGTKLANVTRSPKSDDRSPAWSPDGTEIAFSSDGGQAHARDIDVIDVQSRVLRNVTKGAGINYDPAWAPDGRQIAFASERTDDSTGEYDQHYEIYVWHQDGEVAKLTHNDSDDAEPVWSPDGTRIAFISKRDGNWEIYVMNADGSAQQNLSHSPADDEQPAWSPDGKEIAFTSDRDNGLEELYVMDAGGTAVRELTNVPTGKSRPVWSPDSRSIAFINRSDQGIYVMHADGTRMRRLLTGVTTGGGLAWQPSMARRSAPASESICKKPGVRYAGTTREGAEVCFTLTRDRRNWLEIGFRFSRASGCPRTTGKTYYEGRAPVTGRGRIALPGFTATIRGAQASGVLEDAEVCGHKTFTWSARRRR